MSLIQRMIVGKPEPEAPAEYVAPLPLAQETDPCPYCGAKGVKHRHGAVKYACGTFISIFGINMSDKCQERTLESS